MTNVLLVVPLALCSAWALFGTFASWFVRRRPVAIHPSRELPPVTILKPLAGADVDLEANLESLFLQDHPRFELVLGVTSPDDPAIAVVERLRARHPGVPARLVVHEGGRGVNPKVRNLLGMIGHASHDIVVISDSNVVAPSHYVSEAARILVKDEKLGLVTHLFAGTGESSVGAALESVQLAGFCASGTALPTLVGDALVVGKSMMFSRATLASIGGLERVADVLAEDWVLGKMFQHAGLPVHLAPTVLRNVTRGTTIHTFLARQLRWAMMRARLRPVGQLLEIVTSPLAMLPFALAALGPVRALAWCALVLFVRDTGGWLVLRGHERAWLPFVLAPLREVLLLSVWACAPFKRHVTWRGHRVRLGMGTVGFDAPRARRSLSGTRKARPR